MKTLFLQDMNQSQGARTSTFCYVTRERCMCVAQKATNFLSSEIYDIKQVKREKHDGLCRFQIYSLGFELWH